MKRDGDLRVQYRIVPVYPSGSIWIPLFVFDSLMTSGKIYYRIEKSQLPWWKRNFLFNPWKKLYFCGTDGTHYDLFRLSEFTTHIKPLKTLKEVEGYLHKEDDKARRAKDEWYDELK